MRQGQKVLWVVLSTQFLNEIWKNGTRDHGRMFVGAKGKQQKYFRQLQCQEQCIERIPYYPSGLSRAQFLRQPCSKQLYTKLWICSFIYLFIFVFINYLFIYLFIYFVVIRGFLILKSSWRNLPSLILWSKFCFPSFQFGRFRFQTKRNWCGRLFREQRWDL